MSSAARRVSVLSDIDNEGEMDDGGLPPSGPPPPVAMQPGMVSVAGARRGSAAPNSVSGTVSGTPGMNLAPRVESTGELSAGELRSAAEEMIKKAMSSASRKASGAQNSVELSGNRFDLRGDPVAKSMPLPPNARQHPQHQPGFIEMKSEGYAAFVKKHMPPPSVEDMIQQGAPLLSTSAALPPERLQASRLMTARENKPVKVVVDQAATLRAVLDPEYAEKVDGGAHAHGGAGVVAGKAPVAKR